MAKKRDTGKCGPYSETDLVSLGSHVASIVEATGDAPAAIRAQVEFHGVIARANDGVRGFTLDKLSAPQKARVVEAAKKAADARKAARETQPKKSYRSTDWRVQFAQLLRTQKGYEAMNRAGVSASKQTLNRWLMGEQSPSKANREAIARAYEGARMEGVHAASRKAAAGAREVGKVFDQVVAEAYGENGVRFRNIQR